MFVTYNNGILFGINIIYIIFRYFSCLTSWNDLNALWETTGQFKKIKIKCTIKAYPRKH